MKRLEQVQLQRDYEEAIAVLEHIPKEIIDEYTGKSKGRENAIDEVL